MKVAVLDTGVDKDNVNIFKYERRIKFLRGDAEDNMDYDGHGTLVVQLLLTLAVNVEVYVYKIAETRESLDLSAERIKAIAEVSRNGEER